MAREEGEVSKVNIRRKEMMDDGEEGCKGCLMGVSLTRDDCQEIAYRVKLKHTNQRTRPGGPLGFVDVKWGTLLHSKASGSLFLLACTLLLPCQAT